MTDLRATDTETLFTAIEYALDSPAAIAKVYELRRRYVERCDRLAEAEALIRWQREQARQAEADVQRALDAHARAEEFLA
jgi:hypothetical protein